MSLRESNFPAYKFEDKSTENNPRARVSIMVKNDLRHQRLTQFEDNENPMLTLLFKEKRGKHLAIVGIYRQWKAPGEINPNNSDGISRQCRRFKMMAENLEKISAAGFEMLVGGDINIDSHPANDPCSRAEIKALNPLLEDVMLTLNLS